MESIETKSTARKLRKIQKNAALKTPIRARPQQQEQHRPAAVQTSNWNKQQQRAKI